MKTEISNPDGMLEQGEEPAQQEGRSDVVTELIDRALLALGDASRSDDFLRTAARLVLGRA